MILLKIAFRNIFRHKRRSFLTGMMMAGGCTLFGLFFGMVDGTYGNLIDMITRNQTGHIQLHMQGYLDKPTIYKRLDDPDKLVSTVESLPYIESWAPRVYTPALAFAGKKTTGTKIEGIDPLRESHTTRLKERVSRGNFLSRPDADEIMVTDGLARILNIDLGNEVALISQGIDGSIANDLFTVTGIVGNRESSLVESICFMHIDRAREFLAMDAGVHEIAIVLSDHSRTKELTALLKSNITNPDVAVEPWQIVESAFYRAMQADLKGNRYSIAVFSIIIAVGVLNTVLMVLLERTREFGVLRALGTRPVEIFQLIIYETAFLAIISIIAGTIAGVLANWWFLVHGITYPTPIEYGGYVFSKLTAKITLRSITHPALIVFFTALLVSLWPAVRAARVIPVKAMRSG